MRKFWAVVSKDLLLEARQKDLWVVMLAFALLDLFLAAFSFGHAVRPAAPGILWMAFLYAGMLSIGRGFTRESDDGTLLGIALAPGGRWPVFWAKLAVAFMALLAMEGIVMPLYLILFGLGLGRLSMAFVVVLVLGALGVASVGILMAAIGMNIGGHDAVMPVLLMPLLVPVAILAVKATMAVWHHQSAIFWIRGLGAVDLIFLALPLLAFEYLWEG